MQRKKNIALLIIFLSLLLWTIVYLNLGGRHSSIALDENKFSVKDTAAIREIRITGNSVSNILSKVNGVWMVNNKFPLDPSMKKVLMSVLYQVRVKRTVPKNTIDKIRDDVRKNGFRIEIIKSDGNEHIFYAGGDGISLSYFMDEDNIPYIVQLPGYESYVTGIFEVQENDWRDRLIFQTSWLGIKSLSLSYTSHQGDNVHITSENNLYRIQGIQQLDTTALMSYIDEISYFYTDRYLNPGQVRSYDSLKNTAPFAHLNVDALGMTAPIIIDFFQPIPGENVMLGLLNHQQMCLFGRKRIEAIFKKKKDFILK